MARADRKPIKIMTTEPLLLHAEHVEPGTFFQGDADCSEAEAWNCVHAGRAVIVRNDAHEKELRADQARRRKAAEAQAAVRDNP